jgi:hypothetical protein
VARARQLIDDALPSSYSQDISSGEEQVGGRTVVVITVRTRIPVIGFLGPARTMTVRGHALEEGP